MITIINIHIRLFYVKYASNFIEIVINPLSAVTGFYFQAIVISFYISSNLGLLLVF